MKRLRSLSLVGCIALGACGEGASDARTQNAGGSGGSDTAGGSAGLTAGDAGGTVGGAAGNALGGSAGDVASAGTSGANSGGGMVGTTGGSAGALGGTPTGVTVTTHDFDVQGQGTVFNVADNYFNDGFVPRTPVANFGCHSPIIALQNADGSLDIAWLDYATGNGRPWALPSPGMVFITHIDPTLTTATTVATGISSYKLLGFTQDGAGAAYIAYNQDHALKTDEEDDQNNLNGNELHVAKLSEGAVVWDQLLFGDQDNNADETKGDPAGAASSVLGYDAQNDVLVLYLGHSMMWTPIRHQAGFFRLLNPASGSVLPPAGDNIIHFGAGWWYSHNFNQRLIIEGGNYYVLAHGDAFARQLGFARWSLAGYTDENTTDFDQPYWVIAGNEGDNNTNAQTGQFARMPDGRFAIVHTSSEGRAARDVRVVLADGSDGTADSDAAQWLTSNPMDTHATMPKVELLGEQLLVTYALWPAESHDLTWYATLLDASLTAVVPAAVVANVEFVDSAPLFRFSAGPYAGQVGWVSGNAAHTLSVGIMSPSYD